MGPSSDYNFASTGGGGKLKLKGAKVADGRVGKKKGKKKRKKQQQADEEHEQEREELKVARESKSRDGSEERKGGDEGVGSGGDDDDERGVVVGKTEAEKRYEEVRKKRLDERLKREGVKTHKERVEELNKYLSALSEHHDMPRIGPG